VPVQPIICEWRLRANPHCNMLLCFSFLVPCSMPTHLTGGRCLRGSQSRTSLPSLSKAKQYVLIHVVPFRVHQYPLTEFLSYTAGNFTLEWVCGEHSYSFGFIWTSLKYKAIFITTNPPFLPLPLSVLYSLRRRRGDRKSLEADLGRTRMYVPSGQI